MARQAGASAPGEEKPLWSTCAGVCQSLLVSFFSLHFVVVCFYSGATSWYTSTLRRKTLKGRRAWKCTSQKGGRRKRNGLQCRETGHETRVLVCANFCWIPLCFLQWPHKLVHHTRRRKAGKRTAQVRKERGENWMMFLCFVKPVMKCLCWWVPIFAGFLCVFFFVFFTMAPQTGAPHVEKKSREE